jgi:HlyD family secretion protein
MKKRIAMKKLIMAGVAGAALLVGGRVFGGALIWGGAGKAADYEYAVVRRGSIEKTVSASGSLEPASVVAVLPQMNGRVEEVFADYNSEVSKGEVLARLNTETLQLQRRQKAALVETARAQYELLLATHQTQEKLAAKSLISEHELRTSKTQLDAQAASLSSAQADLAVIETEITQYAYITAPIDGVVLVKNLNPGDTVNTNGTASIFTLAENLREMRIQAGVGELEIGSVYEGQEARFTVDALPGRAFSGTVLSRRLMPSSSSGGVSYTVVVGVENQDGTLLPGMTCSVDFVVEERVDILRVSNAALRYQPSWLSATEIADLVAKAGGGREPAGGRGAAQTRQAQAPSGASGFFAGAGGGGQAGAGWGGGPGQAAREGAGGLSAALPKTLWHLNSSGKPEPLIVQTGVSDGSYTELRAASGSDADLENLMVILREKL